MHFTQQPSTVTATAESSIVVATLQGFITTPMLAEQFEDWSDSYGQQMPGSLLVDLRQVSGYASGSPTLARRWLERAAARGVRRIALVATSSVLRTIVQVISRDVGVELCCFGGHDAARIWLEQPPSSPPAADQHPEPHAQA